MDSCKSNLWETKAPKGEFSKLTKGVGDNKRKREIVDYFRMDGWREFNLLKCFCHQAHGD